MRVLTHQFFSLRGDTERGVDKDVEFKLDALYNTTVEAKWKDGQLQLILLPEIRGKSMEVMMK